MIVFGASCDSPEKNKEFAEKLGLKFPLLSDADKSVAKAWGILVRDRFAKRVTFVIDPEGKIAHIESDVDVRNHGQQLVQVLNKLGVPKKDD